MTGDKGLFILALDRAKNIGIKGILGLYIRRKGGMMNQKGVYKKLEIIIFTDRSKHLMYTLGSGSM